MFLRVKEGGEGKFNRPVQVWGSTCGFVARSEDSQRVRSINRITPQGSHRYSRRGHDTIVLHVWHRLVEELTHIKGCRIVSLYDRVHVFSHLKVLLHQLRNDDFGVAFSAELWLNVEHSQATIALSQQVSNILTIICCHHNGWMLFYKMSDEHLCVLSRELPC